MKKIVYILSIMFLFIRPVYSADWALYLDTGASGGNDGGRDGTDPNDPSDEDNWTDAFETMYDAEDYIDEVDWVTLQRVPILYCRASTGAADTTYVLWDGGTYDGTYHPHITGYDFPADGVWDETKYLLHNNDSDTMILKNYEDYLHIKNIQVKVTASSTNTREGIAAFNMNSPSNFVIEGCLIKCVSTGTGTVRGIDLSDSDTDFDIFNTIVTDFKNGSNSSHYGILIQDANSSDIFNTTVYNCYYGIRQIGGTCTAINCAVGACYDDFSGTISMDYIVSDDDHSGDCANYWSNPTAGADDWSSDFVNPGTDFDLLATATDIIGHGLDDPGSGLYSDDITGFSRTSTWDIGAFEYDDRGGSGNPSGSSGFIKLGWKGAGKSTGKQN
jgi:hypothetical protein